MSDDAEHVQDQPATPERKRSPISGAPVPPPRWKKGESGNPGGRPKGGSIREAIRSFSGGRFSNEELAAIAAGKTKRIYTVAERIAARHCIESIAKGKLVDLAYEQVDGPAPRLDVTTTATELATLTDEELDALAARLSR